MNTGLLIKPSKFKINKKRADAFFDNEKRENIRLVVEEQKFCFADFSEVDVSLVIFKNCVFNYCLFKNMHETDFKKCYFYSCDFFNSFQVINVSFISCYLTQCKFKKMAIETIAFKENFINETVFLQTRFITACCIISKNMCYKADFTGITGSIEQPPNFEFEDNVLLESKVLYWSILRNIYNTLIDTDVLGRVFTDVYGFHFYSNSLKTILDVVLESNVTYARGLNLRMLYLNKETEKEFRTNFYKLLEETKEKKELLYERNRT
jgi:hypothetical protein